MYADLCKVAEIVFKGRSSGKKKKRAAIRRLVREGRSCLARETLVNRVLFKQGRGRLRFPAWAELYNLLGLTGSVSYF